MITCKSGTVRFKIAKMFVCRTDHLGNHLPQKMPSLVGILHVRLAFELILDHLCEHASRHYLKSTQSALHFLHPVTFLP